MILYKYVGLPAALAILDHKSLGFSRATFLNDPFDTPVAEPLPTSNPMQALFNDVGALGKSLVWEKNSAILSLTRTPTNALMWAHYADHHRGVVLAIDTEAAGLLDPQCNLVPAHFGNVIYARHRPRGPYHSNFGVSIKVGETHHFVIEHYEKWQRLFLTKPIEWAYEEEVRVVKTIDGLKAGEGSNPSGKFTVIIHQDRPLHCYHLPPGSITSIYAGARMEKPALALLTTAAGPVPVRRALADQSTYQIIIKADPKPVQT